MYVHWVSILTLLAKACVCLVPKAIPVQVCTYNLQLVVEQLILLMASGGAYLAQQDMLAPGRVYLRLVVLALKQLRELEYAQLVQQGRLAVFRMEVIRLIARQARIC